MNLICLVRNHHYVEAYDEHGVDYSHCRRCKKLKPFNALRHLADMVCRCHDAVNLGDATRANLDIWIDRLRTYLQMSGKS